MLKLQIIIGSTREGRNADPVARWVVPAARSNGAFEAETLDLREWPLPFFRETLATVGDAKDPAYSEPLVKRWNAKIKEADAYLILTPEYNHGLPAVLKNAVDSVFFSHGFRHKAVGFVGYSAGVSAGVRAIEQLNQILLAAEAVPLAMQSLIPLVANAFDAQAKPVNPALDAGLAVQLQDLAWMAQALKKARAEGQLAPPLVRVRAALAKQ